MFSVLSVRAKTLQTECAECQLHLVVFCTACFHKEAVDVLPCVTRALLPTPKQIHKLNDAILHAKQGITRWTLSSSSTN